MTDSQPPEAPSSEHASSAHPYNPLIDGHTAPGPGGPLTAEWLDNNLSKAAHGRHDGWTPERKRIFHQTLAEVGVVSEAARAAGMSARAAYNLRNRDPLFDAGWDAALLLARRRLADDLYSRAVNGCVEQIHKDGAIVAERHRYDNRLSIAVLTRLDTRLDRAEARGDGALHLSRSWDAYLDALGEDRADDARALIDPAAAAAAAKTAQERELRELRAAQEAEADSRDVHTVWQDDDGSLWTDYPPPPGFDPDDEEGRYGDDDYRRCLTPEEQEPVAAFYGEQPNDEVDPECHRQREHFFSNLRAQFAHDATGTAATGNAATGNAATGDAATGDAATGDAATGGAAGACGSDGDEVAVSIA